MLECFYNWGEKSKKEKMYVTETFLLSCRFVLQLVTNISQQCMFFHKTRKKVGKGTDYDTTISLRYNGAMNNMSEMK